MIVFKLLYQFEWHYHVQKKVFWFAFFIFLFLAFTIANKGATISNENINSPIQIANSLGLISLWSVFIISIFSSRSMLRDSENQMTELIYSTPIKKSKLLFSRFAGVFSASLAILCSLPIGLFLSTLFNYNFSPDEASIGPIELWPYIWAMLILVIPSLYFICCLIFSIAALTRNQILVYATAFFILGGYWLTAMFIGSPFIVGSIPSSPETQSLAALLDPFGISSSFDQVKYYTAYDRNTKSLSLSGTFLQNRLLLLGTGSVLLIMTYLLFNMKLFRQSSRKPSERNSNTNADHFSFTHTSKPIVSHSNEFSQFDAFLARTHLEINCIIKSWPFWSIILIFSLMMFFQINIFLTPSEFRSSVHPTTGFMLKQFNGVLPIFALLVTLVYSGEIAWRERKIHIASLIDSTNTFNFTLFAAKFFALISIPFIMISSGIIVALSLQIINGYTNFEIELYLSNYYYIGLPLIIFSLNALFFQTITKNKYLGMALCLTFVLIIPEILDLKHPLLRLFTLASPSYFEITGYGSSKNSFFWLSIYTGSFSLLLIVIANSLWPRGNLLSLKKRSVYAISSWDRRKTLLTATCLISFVFAGGYIFYQINIQQLYLSEDEAKKWAINYEKRYQAYSEMPPLTRVGIKTQLDIYPASNYYEIKGQYRLINKTKKPVDKVLIHTNTLIRQEKLSINNAKIAIQDDEFGHTLFELAEAIEPNGETSLNFSLVYLQSDFKDGPPLHNISKNGTTLFNYAYLPRIGYQPSLTLQEASERRESGLPPLAPIEKLDRAIETANGDLSTDSEWVDFEAIISVPMEQIAVAPGKLIEQQQRNSRNYFHYKTEHPINLSIGYSSANYSVLRNNYDGINTEIYFLEDYKTNLHVISQAVKDSLSYFNNNFGRYHSPHLRLVATPKITGGLSRSQMVFLSNSLFFADYLDNSNILVNQPYRITAHEIAHQWWGLRLQAANSKQFEGAGVLVESLARYSEMLILEQNYGKVATARWIENEHNQYLRGRASESGNETPLYRATNEKAYLMYSKGIVAFNALKNILGSQTINRALRELIKNHSYPKPPATTLDLISILKSHSPDSSHNMIDEWFKKIIVYDLAVNSTQTKQLANGDYQVTIDIDIERLEINAHGKEVSTTINNYFDIGIYRGNHRLAVKSDNNSHENQLLHLKAYYFNEKRKTLTIIVKQKPTKIVIDPYINVIDKMRSNNISELTINS